MTSAVKTSYNEAPCTSGVIGMGVITAESVFYNVAVARTRRETKKRHPRSTYGKRFSHHGKNSKPKKTGYRRVYTVLQFSHWQLL